MVIAVACGPCPGYIGLDGRVWREGGRSGSRRRSCLEAAAGTVVGPTHAPGDVTSSKDLYDSYRWPVVCVEEAAEVESARSRRTGLQAGGSSYDGGMERSRL